MRIDGSGDTAQMMSSIEQMNNLMKVVSNTEMQLADKMLRANVAAKVEGLGENIDCYA